jgi:hypothetical protein
MATTQMLVPKVTSCAAKRKATSHATLDFEKQRPQLSDRTAELPRTKRWQTIALSGASGLGTAQKSSRVETGDASFRAFHFDLT